jgi:1-acyl-sn-glycerol-3-phosphate acyltransferase
MFHLIAVAVVLIAFLIFSYPVILSQKKLAQTDPEKQQAQSLKIVQDILGLIFRLTGSELTVLGRDNIPDDQPVLYVGNHSSYFDIVAAYPQVKGPTGFVAKKEMESYLTLADWMRLVNCVFLDRKDIKAGLKSILEAVGHVKNGVSMWIFPEGTRNESKDITDLMVFHEGSMKIAEKGGCLVIPVAITGTRDIFENHIPWIHPSKVTIEFGSPVNLKELAPEDKKRSGAYVREQIIKMLEEEQLRRK